MMKGGANLSTLPYTVTEAEEMAVVSTKKLLSVCIFRLAKDALTRCKRSKNPGPVMGILEVYILTVSALEALINEIALEKIDQRREAKKSVNPLKVLVLANKKGQYEPLDRKYDELPKILWNKSLEKGGPPPLWNDFVALIQLRNEIVHYSPKREEPGYLPDYLESIYHRIFPGRKLSNDSSPLMDRICNVAMGQWAFDTGKCMIYQLLSLWNTRDPLRWDYIILFESSGIGFAGLV